MQAQRMDHQIMRPRSQVKDIVISNDPRPWHPRPPKVCERRDDGWPRKPSVNLVQSFLYLGGGILLQEQGRAARGAVTVTGQGGTVGQDRGHLHGGQLRGTG
jgi:hypothetical protein